MSDLDENDSIPDVIRPSTDDSEEAELRNALMTVVREIEKEDEEKLKQKDHSVREMVNSHLARFYDSIKDLTGVDVQKLLDFNEFILDDTDQDKDDNEDRLEGYASLEDLKDYPYESDVVYSNTPIEDLLKCPEFTACLDTLAEGKDGMTKSTEDLIDSINARISTFSIDKDDTEVSKSPAVRALKSSEGVPASDADILNSAEFSTFFRNILDISRTEMKDVFEGDDDLPSTKEFEDFCLETFKKLSSESLDTCSELTGPKFVLTPVKDSPDEVEVTEKDCQKLWKTLALKSYYDCVAQNLESLGLVEPLHRVLLIGKQSPQKRHEAKKSFDNAVEVIQQDILDEVSKMTGSLIIFKNFFFHVAEGSARVIESIIEKTAELVEDEIVMDAKVIETIHEIPNRFFEYWNSVCVERTERQPVAKAAYEADLARRMKEFREKLLVLASYIQTLPYEDFGEKIQLLVQVDVLPEEGELSYLFYNDFFLTVKEYVNMYLRQTLFTSSEEFECPPVKKFDVCI